jgi:hypothetical protein
MSNTSTTVERWLGLPHDDLTREVRRAVRGGYTHSSLWTVLGAHPVLAARVSGMLSALQAEMTGHRNQAMWTMWINQARHSLTSPSPGEFGFVRTGSSPYRPQAVVFRAGL